MMGQYAKDTTVPAEKSRADIERALNRYGASRFGYMNGPDGATIAFECHGRRIRFEMPLPDRTDRAFTRDRWGNMVAPATVEKKFDQACRQRWRALLLTIKAKLESVESGIATFEDEFLPYTMLPDGQTVSQWIQPQIEQAYMSGKQPRLLTE